MIESLPAVVALLAVVALAISGVPRLLAYWYAHRAWTASGADLGAKFGGLLRFGKNGSYLALIPKDEDGSVRFTKHSVDGRGTFFRLRVEGDRLDPDRIRTIEAKLEALSGGIDWTRAGAKEPEVLEVDIAGPVASDAIAMEGVAAGVLVALGFDSSQKYLVSFRGPTDEEAVADYYFRD